MRGSERQGHPGILTQPGLHETLKKIEKTKYSRYMEKCLNLVNLNLIILILSFHAFFVDIWWSFQLIALEGKLMTKKIKTH